MKLTTEGHTKQLECCDLKGSCGSIFDGVVFQFTDKTGKEGCWVLDYKELVNLVLAATNYRIQKSRKKGSCK